MSKKKDTFINMVVSLFVITIISGFSLGYVNDLTAGPKAKAKLERKVNALKLVLPEFDNNPVEDILLVKSDKAKDSVEIYPAFENNNFIGAAVIGSTEKGFSGLIKIMVGFNPEGTIQNIVVLEQKETPGLGTKMKDDKFIQQYRDKNPSSFDIKTSKDGGEIGTPIKDLIAEVGGLPEGTRKLINGGPMMGKAIKNADVPVTKGTSGILAISEEEASRGKAENCIRCGECISVCPMGLEPHLLMSLSERALFERTEKEDIRTCVECGSCSYVCPSHRPLLDYIRFGKNGVNKLEKAKK